MLTIVAYVNRSGLSGLGSKIISRLEKVKEVLWFLKLLYEADKL